MILIMKYRYSFTFGAMHDPYGIFPGTMAEANRYCKEKNKKAAKYEYYAVRVKELELK